MAWAGQIRATTRMRSFSMLERPKVLRSYRHPARTATRPVGCKLSDPLLLQVLNPHPSLKDIRNVWHRHSVTGAATPWACCALPSCPSSHVLHNFSFHRHLPPLPVSHSCRGTRHTSIPSGAWYRKARTAYPKSVFMDSRQDGYHTGMLWRKCSMLPRPSGLPPAVTEHRLHLWLLRINEGKTEARGMSATIKGGTSSRQQLPPGHNCERGPPLQYRQQLGAYSHCSSLPASSAVSTCLCASLMVP